MQILEASTCKAPHQLVIEFEIAQNNGKMIWD